MVFCKWINSLASGNTTGCAGPTDLACLCASSVFYADIQVNPYPTSSPPLLLFFTISFLFFSVRVIAANWSVDICVMVDLSIWHLPKRIRHPSGFRSLQSGMWEFCKPPFPHSLIPPSYHPLIHSRIYLTFSFSVSFGSRILSYIL